MKGNTMHPAFIEIDTQQLIENLRIIRSVIAKDSKLCLPVKANAYGHGLLGISKLTEKYVDYFGVACSNEGVILRENNITKPILVFGPIDEQQIPDLVANDLEITISSIHKANLVARYCEKVKHKCRVHIKVDTGLHRIGIRPENAPQLIDLIIANPYFELVGIYSHFASSEYSNDDFTIKQMNLFNGVVAYAKTKQPKLIAHIANSAAIANYPDSHLDMVRPGIMSYGYTAFKVADDSPLRQIKSCFTVKARVCYFKVVAENQGISYGHHYFTAKQTRIITLPIGYGDGYRRGLSNCGEVLFNGKYYTVSGNVCMDMLMIDIGNDEAYIGDEVVLLGRQGAQEVSASVMADKLNTIVYEILVGFTERIPRIFI